jgi:hypothetical protein
LLAEVAKDDQALLLGRRNRGEPAVDDECPKHLRVRRVHAFAGREGRVGPVLSRPMHRIELAAEGDQRVLAENKATAFVVADDTRVAEEPDVPDEVAAPATDAGSDVIEGRGFVGEVPGDPKPRGVGERLEGRDVARVHPAIVTPAPILRDLLS